MSALMRKCSLALNTKLQAATPNTSGLQFLGIPASVGMEGNQILSSRLVDLFNELPDLSRLLPPIWSTTIHKN